MDSRARAWIVISALAVSGCRSWFEATPPREERAEPHKRGGREHAKREKPAHDRTAPDQSVGTWDDDRPPEGERDPRKALSGTELAALEAIGYVADGHEVTTGAATGVLAHDARAYPGTNLLVSAHALSVDLVDMDGKVLHTWTVPPDQAPAVKVGEGVRRALLGPDGSLYVVLEGKALLKLGVDSKVLWHSDRAHHHDLQLDDQGRLHTLSREGRKIAAFRPEPVLEDRITVLDAATGAEVREISVLKALARSEFHDLYALARKAPTDALHTNSLEILDGRAAARNPAFAAGRYLLSSRVLDTVFVLDPETETVVWAQRGPWKRQHDPKILDDGTLMVFDNHNPGPSRVIVADPKDGSVISTWEGGDQGAFFTECCGTAERLPNQDLFVVSTDDGIAVELAPDGSVVWRYRTPYTVSGGKNIARLFDVVRTPPAEELPWLKTR